LSNFSYAAGASVSGDSWETTADGVNLDDRVLRVLDPWLGNLLDRDVERVLVDDGLHLLPLLAAG